MIPNPAYRGIWSIPSIPNPNYKGIWQPRRIPNPDTAYDDHPHRLNAMRGIAFEFWSNAAHIAFDNIYIGQDVNAANQFAENVWKVKRAKEFTLETGIKKETGHQDARKKAQTSFWHLMTHFNSKSFIEHFKMYFADVESSPKKILLYPEFTLFLVATMTSLVIIFNIIIVIFFNIYTACVKSVKDVPKQKAKITEEKQKLKESSVKSPASATTAATVKKTPKENGKKGKKTTAKVEEPTPRASRRRGVVEQSLK